MIVVFLIPFLVYLITLSPTVFVGDSGELITSAYSLGIAHPPGYPLWIVLGKIFTLLIPFGNIAYRVNLISAIFGAVTVTVLYLLTKQCIKILRGRDIECSLKPRSLEPLIPFFVVLVFAFSRTFWSQALISEVYTLNALFVGLTLLLVIKGIKTLRCQGVEVSRCLDIEKHLKPRTLFLLLFIFGLSLCNHHTMILFVPIILVSSKCVVGSGKYNYSLLTTCYLLFLLSLCIYLYLPIRSLANPSIDWSNPENFRRIVQHITRQQYGSVSKNIRTFNLFFQQMTIYGRLLINQYFSLVLLFIIPGVIYFLRKSKEIFYLLLSTFVLTSVVLILILNFSNTQKDIYAVKVFFIPSYIIITVFIAGGVFYLIDLTSKWRR